MIETFKQLRYYIKCDLYRYTTDVGIKSFLRGWFIPGFRYTFFLRVCQYAKSGIIHWMFRLPLRHYQFKYGITIHPSTQIGPGLYIGHFGGIVVNPNAIIGSNVNLSPNVLIGHKLNKDIKGFEYPIIGDKVYIANSAKIMGGVKIGNMAVIGVNTLVTHDVEEKSVVAGSPQREISKEGSGSILGSIYGEV